ncbi:hypothetical protein ACFSJM_08485 [Lactococcus formosensis subsp. bovis]|uniref:hypothetical protein n=1 Tax=Lactococcus formosensis TaxID=1281486 RepID=UPI001BCC709F|nr:hypothetical protein [Lactococcus formosensis]
MLNTIKKFLIREYIQETQDDYHKLLKDYRGKCIELDLLKSKYDPRGQIINKREHFTEYVNPNGEIIREVSISIKTMEEVDYIDK